MMDAEVKIKGCWIDRRELLALRRLIPWYKTFVVKKRFRVKEVKRVLREQTVGGRYWKARPHYNVFTKTVTISSVMDRVWVNLVDGVSYYEDRDDDPCTEDRSGELYLKREPDGKLKLYRRP